MLEVDDVLYMFLQVQPANIPQLLRRTLGSQGAFTLCLALNDIYVRLGHRKLHHWCFTGWMKEGEGLFCL